jgi:hypothetical protein
MSCAGTSVGQHIAMTHPCAANSLDLAALCVVRFIPQ